MDASDFEYDNRYLSDFGFVICNFNGNSETEIVSGGSKISFNTVSKNSGRIHSLVGTKYDECITTTFHICKDPCRYNDLRITNDEYRNIMRWLNRKEFLDFQFLNTDNVEKAPCFFKGSFNISKIMVGQVLYGLELTLTTNKPFGYGQEVIIKLNVTDPGKIYNIEDNSDEIGYIYPSLKIVLQRSGRLTIQNDMTDCIMVIDNCTAGEVITIDGDTQIIQTSNTKHDIYNDFNYDFFRIGNTTTERINEVHVSLPCQLEVRYCPIIKDAPN